MRGKVTFIFDDGLQSAYECAYPMFKEKNIRGCLALFGDFAKNKLTEAQALAMQSDGWEIMSHSVHHVRLNDALSEDEAREDILSSKNLLEKKGFVVRQFVSPMSVCDEKWYPLLYTAYDAAYTVYKNSAQCSFDALVIPKPTASYELHRASLNGMTPDRLKACIDYVSEHDDWLVFYAHDISPNGDVTMQTLAELLTYIIKKGVAVVTGSQAIDSLGCKTRRIKSGFDGETCLVHARGCADSCGEMLITAQNLNVKGSDLFSELLVSRSTDSGRTFSGFEPDSAFARIIHADGTYTLGCDATPMYHRAKDTFIVLGQTVRYATDSRKPLGGSRKTFYAVFNRETGTFNRMKFLELPDRDEFVNAGNGSGQSVELENGDLLIPIYYRAYPAVPQFMSCVIRCRFDGENITFEEIGNALTMAGEPRGVYEPSVIRFNNQYYMTMRGDHHGYFSISRDGLHYSDPSLWMWDDGEILSNYNTQQHWMVCGGDLYLVYTRKAGTNDHVFRHRAPLFAAKVDIANMRLIKETEFVAVPERGARLGNFGVFSDSENKAFVVAAEWMQPQGCEAYGSNNSIYFSEITRWK